MLAYGPTVKTAMKAAEAAATEGTSLEALQIPPEVLKQPTLRLDVGVTHYKSPGAAWAQLVILVVFVDYGDRAA